MSCSLTRRGFLKGSGAAILLASSSPWSIAGEIKRPIKKAIMWATVGVKGSVLEKMKDIKAAGFDGTEMMSHMDVDEVLRARDETGLVIPSVCGAHHWSKPLSDPNPK